MRATIYLTYTRLFDPTNPMTHNKDVVFRNGVILISHIG